MSVLRLLSVFGLKATPDFSKLIVYPEDLLKLSRMPLRVLVPAGQALEKIRMSSAKNKCVMGGAVGATLRPTMLLLF